MALPLDLAYYQLGHHGRKLHQISPHDCRDEMIYIKSYREYELYKRIGGKFVYARNLLPREIEDYYFYSGETFRHCTICERIR